MQEIGANGRLHSEMLGLKSKMSWSAATEHGIAPVFDLVTSEGDSQRLCMLVKALASIMSEPSYYPNLPQFQDLTIALADYHLNPVVE